MNYMPYVIALYIRLSVEDCKVDSLSVENQKVALHQYVDTTEGLENAEVLEFVDNGYSGTNFERPAVQRLLDLVQRGAVNCILVKDFSRFGRNSVEVEYYLEQVFPLYSVRFISINDSYDSAQLQGDTGGITVAFKYLLNELYSKDLSLKYKSAKYVKFKRGEYQSRICPYGYKKGGDGRMEPDEEAANTVQLIFTLAQQGLGAKQIVKALYDRNIPTPAEYKAAHGFSGHDISRCHSIWNESTVARILGDERYIGTYIIGKREVTEVGGHKVRLKTEDQWVKIADHHPPIISREVFDQVQALRPKISCVKKNINTYPLRGKVFCGSCGHAMSRTSSKNPAYICRHSQVDDAAPCHGLRILEEELERIVYGKMLLRFRTVSETKEHVPMTLPDDLNLRIENCLEQKRCLYERLVTQKFRLEEYRVQKAGIDEELYRLRRTLAATKEQTEQTRATCDQIGLLNRLYETGCLTIELADELVGRVEVYPGGRVEPIWR